VRGGAGIDGARPLIKPGEPASQAESSDELSRRREAAELFLYMKREAEKVFQQSSPEEQVVIR